MNEKKIFDLFESSIIQGLSGIMAQIAQKRNVISSGKTLDFDGKSAQWGNGRFTSNPCKIQTTRPKWMKF